MEESKFNLRLPKDLYEWLKMFADSQSRSTNAQIVQILKEERDRQAARAKSDVPPSSPADDDQV
jgi:hypothetical protein